MGTVYAGFGGLKGVIWTDVAQFVILVGGVLAIIIFIICRLPNGVADIWHVAGETNHGFNIGWDSGFWDFNFMQRIRKMELPQIRSPTWNRRSRYSYAVQSRRR